MIRSLRKTIYGKVLMCKDSVRKETVAVKVSALKQSRACHENPMKELEILKALHNGAQSHPNICGLRGHFVDANEQLCTVLEFCDGGELFDVVRDHGAHEDTRAKAYFKQIVAAMEYIHANGVAHLDCSLENLLVHADGTLKLCDFGLARFTQRAPFEKAGRFGKINFMPPEVYAGLEFDGYQNDAWGMGVTLFILLLGVPPFEFPAPSDARFKLITDGRLSHLLKLWKRDTVIDPNAADLISKLLCQAGSRLSLQEIKVHPWLH